MSQNTPDPIRAFQQSYKLNVTGNIDNDTARELGLKPDDSLHSTLERQ